MRLGAGCSAPFQSLGTLPAAWRPPRHTVLILLLGALLILTTRNPKWPNDPKPNDPGGHLAPSCLFSALLSSLFDNPLLSTRALLVIAHVTLTRSLCALTD